MHGHDLLSDVAVSVVAATVFALLARALRQPLLLGYLVAGVVIGPEMGLGLVRDRASISLISEMGLILLLFIIGLEMDLQKLIGAGRPLVLAGTLQFPLCALLGWAAARAVMPAQGARYDALYVGIALALSSTMIVVKLLYDRYELMTFPGRITLGILVFQDVWAILVLAVQPTLADPSVVVLVASLVKGALLILACLGTSRYFLPRLFGWVAKVPELLLVLALAWCFLVSAAAHLLGLSREMGALVAGVALSTFPYNVDVIAKVINIRDFFVTLFFVALGMQIPRPTPDLLAVACGVSAFLVATRFLTVFPILYAAGTGLRAALLPAINLSQLSEFSLVIASLGSTLGHVSGATVGGLTLVFALTSVLTTYMITYNGWIQGRLAAVLTRVGFREAPHLPGGHHEQEDGRPLVFLGFFREASSLLHELEQHVDGITSQTLVVDFNPVVLRELRGRGVAAVYGDIASMDTLSHAAIAHARLVLSTIPDSILKGTTNERLLRQARRLCPEARLIVTADTIPAALALYDAGADGVIVPRIHSAAHLAEWTLAALAGGLGATRDAEIASLRQRNEVIP